MHYLTSLAEKLVNAYQNQEAVLNWAQQKNARIANHDLAAALKAVLEKEWEHGRIDYNLLSIAKDQTENLNKEEMLFADMAPH